MRVDGIGPAAPESGTVSAPRRRRGDAAENGPVRPASAMPRRAAPGDERDIERQWRAMEAVGARLVTDADPSSPRLAARGHAAQVVVRARPPAPGIWQVGGHRRRSESRRPGIGNGPRLARDLAVVGARRRQRPGPGHRRRRPPGRSGCRRSHRGRTGLRPGRGLPAGAPVINGRHRRRRRHSSPSTLWGRPRCPSHFPARNRLIAGLSRGVVLMECGPRSGALYTVTFRPGLRSGSDGRSRRRASLGEPGPQRVIRQGATLVRHAADVLSALGWTSLPASHAGSRAARGRRGRAGGPVSGRAARGPPPESGPLSLDELAVGHGHAGRGGGRGVDVAGTVGPGAARARRPVHRVD